MRLLRDHVDTFIEDLRLETSAQKLIFVITKYQNTEVAIGEEQFSAMKASVNLVSMTTGTNELLAKTSLRHSFNRSQFGEGFIQLGRTEIVGTLDLSRNGAVLLNDGEFISINVEGLPADCKTSIYAIDSPILTRNVLKVDEVQITGTMRDLNLIDKHGLYIPVFGHEAAGAGIERIELEYENRTVVYSYDELRVLQYSINDLAFIKDQSLDATDNGGANLVHFGYDVLLYLNVEKVRRVKLTPFSKDPVTIYTEKDITI